MRETESALSALDGGADDQALVLRLIAANGRSNVHYCRAALHRLRPAAIVKNIELDQFQP